MTISSSSTQKLLKIEPGSYFKLSHNEQSRISKPTTGLIVSSYNNDSTGEVVYNVTLVNGELLLIPKESNA